MPGNLRAARTLHIPTIAALITLAACAQRDTGALDADARSPTVTPGAPHTSPRTEVKRAAEHPPGALDAMPGLACTSSENITTCTSIAYDISGSDDACRNDDANFGAVLAEAGVDLREGIDRGGSRARLAANQLVCIQYVAESKTGGDSWSYVTAIPASLVTRCAKARCPAARAPVRWTGPSPSGECATQSDGRYAATCAAGWLPSAAIDAYSMGLDGRHADPS